MLQLKNLSYHIGDKELFGEMNWVINPGKRLALMGPNGCGKSTLLKIITGELHPAKGDIQKPSDYTIGYLPQEEVLIGKRSLLREVLEGHGEVITIEHELSTIHHRLSEPGLPADEKQRLLSRLGKLEHHFTQIGGYTLESEVKKILTGLGFPEDQLQEPLTQFSGGWRMRAYLARLLVQKPDLLLLDEPTNHLDVPSLEWLESYLTNFSGSVIIVSHDRYFIDRLVQGIGTIENKRFTYYPGNYHYYENQKQLRQEQLLKKAEEIKAEKERLNRFIERFRYKATKAAQVQSRIKMLQKLDEVEIPKTKKSIGFRLTTPVQSFNNVCSIEDLCFSYSDNCVFQNIDLELYRGDKVALVGVNGAGKTTFGRLLFGQLSPTQGNLHLGERVSIGYYAQHQIDSLNLQNTIYQEVLESAAPVYRMQLRDILGLFQFSGNDIEKEISVLSGGEKARVSLAKILLAPVNFLIMDEPTNHLDMQSKESLEKALINYDGTLLLISHDRYFLDKIVTRVIEVDHGRLKLYEGNYTDYLTKKEVLPLSKEEQQEKPVIHSDKERKRFEAEARQRISKERNQLSSRLKFLETEIESIENEMKQLEANMASTAFYKNELEAVDGTRRYQEIKSILAEHYRSWEETGQQLETLLSGF